MQCYGNHDNIEEENAMPITYREAVAVFDTAEALDAAVDRKSVV